MGSETGLIVGLWERLRVRWAKVGETGEDVGVFRLTKVEMGVFADDSGSSTCLCRDSGPSFRAEGLWRGEVLVCGGALATRVRSKIVVHTRLGSSESVPSLDRVEALLRWEWDWDTRCWDEQFDRRQAGTLTMGAP